MTSPMWRRIQAQVERDVTLERQRQDEERAWRIDPDAIVAGFGSALRRERLARGLSQAALARETGTSPDHVLDLERGTKSPTMRTVARLAFALHLRPSELPARTEADTGSQPHGDGRSAPD